MINNVNVTLLRQFLGLYCPSRPIIILTHDVCFISILFRIVSRQNQYHLPLFMINNVNVTLLRHFLGLYCSSKLIIRLAHYVFLISLLFRIVSIQNQFHLPLFIINKVNQFHIPLFMINKVNVTLLRPFLCLYCPSKLIIRLTLDVCFTSVLFRIVFSLNHIDLSLFMIT